MEVYPEIRFPTEIRFEGKPYSTIVGGVPASDKSGGAYDGMTGKFFLRSRGGRSDSAKRIRAAAFSADQIRLSERDIVLRYAERKH